MRPVTIWQLANNPARYGSDAGKFLPIEPTGPLSENIEQARAMFNPFHTYEDAVRYATRHGWEVVPLQPDTPEGNENLDRALKLLRKLQADIGAMRLPSWFGGFEGYSMDTKGMMRVEWGNLDILLNEIDALLQDLTPEVTYSTWDVGIAIRDHLEDKNIEHFTNHDEPTADNWGEVNEVDVSDAHNPIVTLSNGQRFRLNITSID